MGEGDDFFAEELSIIRSYKLREEFPPGVEREAERQAARKISAEDLADRKDLRDALIVTIDGEDTRDIDDAGFPRKVGDGIPFGRAYRGRFTLCQIPFPSR